MITFGKFRVVDLGDLTWNKEEALVCPTNKIGEAQVFIVSHHGLDSSNSPALVNAIHPKVALMDNGEKEGRHCRRPSTRLKSRRESWISGNHTIRPQAAKSIMRPTGLLRI